MNELVRFFIDTKLFLLIHYYALYIIIHYYAYRCLTKNIHTHVHILAHTHTHLSQHIKCFHIPHPHYKPHPHYTPHPPGLLSFHNTAPHRTTSPLHTCSEGFSLSAQIIKVSTMKLKTTIRALTSGCGLPQEGCSLVCHRRWRWLPRETCSPYTCQSQQSYSGPALREGCCPV